MVHCARRHASLVASATFLVPSIAHATGMPGVGEYAILLAGGGAVIGAGLGTITVIVVASTTPEQRRAGRLVGLWCLMTLGLPLALLLLGALALLLYA